MGRMAHAVFISYSSKDFAVADAVRAVLEAASIECWMAPRNINAGQSYAGQITEGIRGARVLLLIFSERSNASEHVLREVERAAHFKLRLLTFRIENFPLSADFEFFLSLSHWLDAFDPPDPATHFDAVVK